MLFLLKWESFCCQVGDQWSNINGKSWTIKGRYQFSKIEPLKVRHICFFTWSLLSKDNLFMKPYKFSKWPTMGLVNDLRATLLNWEVLQVGSKGRQNWPWFYQEFVSLRGRNTVLRCSRSTQAGNQNWVCPLALLCLC